jgi:hypothetical protein
VKPEDYLYQLYGPNEALWEVVGQILTDLREVFVIVPKKVERVDIRHVPNFVLTNDGERPLFPGT